MHPLESLELNSPEFAAARHEAWNQLRRDFGPLAPVKIGGEAAAVVLGHKLARSILDDHGRFLAQPSDPSRPVRMCPSSARFQDLVGDGYARYRPMMSGVDQNMVRRRTITLAENLIGGFAGTGSADLLGEYAVPLTCRVIGQLLGVNDVLIDRATEQVIAMRATEDISRADNAAQGLIMVMAEAVSARRTHLGADLVSWLCTESGDDDEVARRAARIFQAAAEPTWNLLSMALLRLATDPGFGGTVGGQLSYPDAIDEVLYRDPPLDTLVTYPRVAQAIEGMWLPAGQPLAVSLSAANNDPEIHGDDQYLTGNRAHLAWGSGQRSCPAKELALIIVTNALERLVDAIPDITLTVPADDLGWRTGSAHRALTTLPVAFEPMPPLTSRY